MPGMAEPFVIARTADGNDITFIPGMGNRHGLITGATGTGKTISLQVLADHFSQLGVPVFLADVKGDLSGVGRGRIGIGQAQGAARLDRHRRARVERKPGRVLGRLRRAGSSGPHDRRGHGAAIVRPAAQSQ